MSFATSSASPRTPGVTPLGQGQAARTLRRVRNLARLLDSSLQVPGTRFRVGIEPLIGLIPGVGDVVGGGLSTWVIVEAARLKIPRRVLARMVGNVALDTVLGAIPVLGDLFDFGFKANLRNLRLLERELGRRPDADAAPAPDAA